MTKNIKEKYWKICPECKGQGKIYREVSKRRWRNYHTELGIFLKENRGNSEPEIPKKHLDICLICKGSGLSESQRQTKADGTRFPRVAIIGAGIGGTALAIACLHRGIPFDLYERDKSFNDRSQGYGLTLQQASKAIHGLGIDSLEKGLISTRHVVHNHKGKIIGEWGLRKWKNIRSEINSKRKNIHIARQELRLQMLDQLANTSSTHWNHKLVNLSKKQEGTYTIKFETSNGIKKKDADLVIGADGIRSSVRKIVLKNDKDLSYLGCIVILGICSLEKLQSTKSELFDSATVFQTVNGHERIYVMPYDQESIMWQLSFPISESEAKKLSKKGAQAMKSEAIKRLKWHSPIPEILQETPESLITGYPAYDRDPMKDDLLWERGNLSLIGDAAHPMSPFKGQGANQAILDALLLARMITERCEENLSWKEHNLRELILNDFEKEMAERTKAKVIGSREAANVLHTDSVLHTENKPRGRGII